MNYDLGKVREECLRLMGWDKIAERWWGHPDIGVANLPGFSAGIPDPTTSIDDALPLMRKFNMTLMARESWKPRLGEGPWMAHGDADHDPLFDTPYHAIEPQEESAALTVCLAALRCAGFNLKDFEISEDDE